FLTKHKECFFMQNKQILHIITISFVINHFFGRQFKYLRTKTNNDYFLGCTPSDEFFQLADSLEYSPLSVDVTRNISPITDLKAIYKIYKFIKKNKIETVVGHTPKGGMVAMIAAFFAGVQDRVYFRHGIIYETSTGFKRFLLKNIDRLSGTLATKVVCVSQSVKKISEEDNLNAPSKNIILGIGTCNGIDTENKFNPDRQDIKLVLDIKKELTINENDFVIGYVGRLVKDKGINELIEAWKILKEKHQNIKLLLVGPIEERDAISEESKKIIKNDPHIINTGFVLNAAPYFNVMDVFVLPTYREGFPTVSLEASSMKLPVLITKATGCEESIIENKTGLFIKNDPSDIRQKIEFYIENPEMKQLHGDNGRDFVRQHFEETKIWDFIHKNLGY
ncbi:MAG: glycosyltransferase family 4 protein, partial [Chryseobacterium sp.]|nr:glycosyltransferase family 4 protein [Chryseobacterium sp.]